MRTTRSCGPNDQAGPWPQLMVDGSTKLTGRRAVRRPKCLEPVHSHARRVRNRNQGSGPAGTGHMAWMPHPRRNTDMNAASTPYRQGRPTGRRRVTSSAARRDDRYCLTAVSRVRTTSTPRRRLGGMSRIPVARPGLATGTGALLRSRAARLRGCVMRSRRCSGPARSRRRCRSQPGSGR